MKPSRDVLAAAAFLNEAVGARSAGDFDSALQFAGAALGRAPSLGAAHIIFGHILTDQERFADGAQALTIGLKLLDSETYQAPLPLPALGPEPVTSGEIEGSARVDLGLCLVQLARAAPPEDRDRLFGRAKQELEAALDCYLHPLSRQQAEQLLALLP